MFGAQIETKEQSVFVLSSLVINMCSSCPFFFFLVQSWTERAKGQTGDAADLKKRKRAEGGGGGAENENGQAEADENSAKKKKSLDPSSKLAAFAFNKN